MSDLAEAAGVGVATVDRVLNGRQPVRRATAERVLAAAERIGFHATGAIRHRLGTDRPARTLGFLLQQRSTVFYAGLGAALAEATAGSPAIAGRARVEHLEDLSPDAVADRLAKLGPSCNAIAVVAADHPRVTEAIERLRGQGVPVFALISDLSAASLAGYVGLDNWKVGRTAAWAVSRLCKRPGRVGIFVGSHRYRCQETCEISFRSYFREHAPDFQLLEARASLEEARLAHESTLDLLKQNGDLVAVFVAGGGVEGVVRALREEGAAEKLIGIGLDLTDVTRSALIDGVLQLVLSHPLRAMAAALVDAMVRTAAGERPDAPRHTLMPFEIYTPENV
jgi:LacI family transcriptional regulator